MYYVSSFNRNKAVADGAVSFYLDHSVKTRVSKFFYGTDCSALYREEDPDHKSRSHLTFSGVDGRKKLDQAFSTILPKVSSFLYSLILTLYSDGLIGRTGFRNTGVSGNLFAYTARIFNA